MTLTTLLPRLEAGEASRELDFALGKALGLIPDDAEWEQPDDDDPLAGFALSLRRQWELPSYREAKREYRTKVRAYIATRPTGVAEIERWHDENAHPWGDSEQPPCGSVSAYTKSLDAALALAERVLPGKLECLFREAADSTYLYCDACPDFRQRLITSVLVAIIKAKLGEVG